jgi:hypothetical protein
MGGGGGGGGGSGGPAGVSPAGPIGALLGLGALAYAGYNSFYTVEGGHRALLFNRLLGVKEEVHMEGMHFMIPWFEMPVIYDIRPKPRMIQSLTGSKGTWPQCARERRRDGQERRYRLRPLALTSSRDASYSSCAQTYPPLPPPSLPPFLSQTCKW